MFCPWLGDRIYFTFGAHHPAYRASYLSLGLEETTIKTADAYATTTKTLRHLANRLISKGCRFQSNHV
jgi:hypothetical protein